LKLFVRKLTISIIIFLLRGKTIGQTNNTAANNPFILIDSIIIGNSSRNRLFFFQEFLGLFYEKLPVKSNSKKNGF